MTNEELAQQIQSGDHGAILELWTQVRKLILFHFRRILVSEENRHYMARSGLVFDDLEQVGFFAMLDAVQAYKQAGGLLLSSYFRFHVMRRFFDVVGIRSSRLRMEPLNRADSLDQPLPGDSDAFTIGDTIADDSAENAFSDVLERVYNKELHAAIDLCLEQIGPERAHAIRARYYDGRTLSDLSEETGVSPERVRQRERDVLRKLRSGRCQHILNGYRETIISHHGFLGGLQAFRRTWASATELTVERLAEMEQKQPVRYERAALQPRTTDLQSIKHHHERAVPPGTKNENYIKVRIPGAPETKPIASCA